MDLDEAAGQLYAANPDEFMAARTALAKQAKEAGDKALAKQITALRKPTRSAWLVNLVARAEPDRVAELIELGAALQEAQQAMDGDTLRRLSRDRRTLIDALARRAGELGRDQGYPAPDGAVQEVSQSLQAALGRRRHRRAGPGRPTAPGRGLRRVRAGRPRVGPGGLDAGQEEGERRRRSPWCPTWSRTRLRSRRSTRRRRKPRARPGPRPTPPGRRLRRPSTAADEATTRADDLADQVEELRRRLRETETAEREARDGGTRRPQALHRAASRRRRRRADRETGGDNAG